MNDGQEKAPQMRPGDEAPPDEPSALDNVCPVCAGSGRKDDSECENCLGTGMVTEAIGGG